MIPVLLDQIDLADLQRLIEGQVREARDIEYKREFPTGANKDKVHFLRAITSLANSGGGDVVYGMDAKDGVPTVVCGFALEGTHDERQLALENFMRDGVQPRLAGVGFQWIAIADGRTALVIRVKASWNAPHRVVVENHNHFYGRNSVGAYQMDVPELRSAFLLSDSLSTRITHFRTSRLMEVEAGNVAVSMMKSGMSIMHILPVSAFSANSSQRLSASKELARGLAILGDTPHCFDVNLHGAVAFNDRSQSNPAYAQIFRDGCLELVAGDPWYTGEVPLIEGEWLVTKAVDALSKNIATLSSLGIDGPYVVSFCLVEVQGYGLRRHQGAETPSPRLKRSTVMLPDAFVEDAQFNSSVILKPIFDVLWNAFGYERCPYFVDSVESQG